MKAANLSFTSFTKIVSKDVFEKLFLQYFKPLHSYAFVLVRDGNVAEEIVQEVFLKIWERKEKIVIRRSVSAYLYRCVYNQAMDWIKKRKPESANILDIAAGQSTNEDPLQSTDLRELENRLHYAILKLPERCRIIFIMSRYDGMGYNQIASELKLSIKTVESQVSKALKILRNTLSDTLN